MSSQSPVPLSFSAEAVQAIFKGVLIREALPALDVCAKVGRDLHRIHRRDKAVKEVIKHKITADIDSGFTKMRKALLEVRKALPSFTESFFLSKDFGMPGFHTGKSYEKNTDLCINFLKSLGEMEILVAGTFQSLIEEHWHEIATDIFTLFKNVMESINPKKTYGASASGPAVRFIIEALKITIDYTPTPAAIKEALGRKLESATER